MILIGTLNLLIYKTAIVDGLEINSQNHIQDHRMVVGDGGIYSALMAKILQGEPYVVGVAGGIGGRFIKNFMDKNRIKSDLLMKETEVRSVLKIIDSIHMTETTFVDDTFGYDEADIKNLKYKFLNNLKDANVIILNSNPVNDEISQRILNEWMLLSAEQHHKIIVSLSGSELRKAMEYSPYGVVIDEADLQELLQDELANLEDEQYVVTVLHKYAMEHHIKLLAFDNSQNKNIYVFSKNKICCAKYGKFAKELDELKAKDFLVGTMAVCISRKYEIEKMTKLLAAVRSAIITENFPKVCQRKDIDVLYNKMKLIEILNTEQL